MSLSTLLRDARTAIVAFEPDVYSAAECGTLIDELAATEKACAAARVRAAAAASVRGEHRARGFVDAADWVARTSGSTPREAREALATVTAASQCPETHDALVAGELSLAEAGEITRTEAAVPGSEHDLLEAARMGGLGAVRNEARKRRVGARDRDQLRAEQWRRREVRHWRDDIGMVCGRFALPPEVGVPFVNRLDAETDRVRRAARREGSTDSHDTHAADAFVRMVKGEGTSAGRTDLVLVCDLSAYRRGHTHDGEVSHFVGGGPVPVSTLRALAEDAFLEVVLHDGVKIDTVKHFGRHLPAELRTALELGPVPEFDGVTCSRDGCERKYELDWHHRNPVANGAESSFENLEPDCKPHHWEATERQRRAGLLGPRRAKSPP